MNELNIHVRLKEARKNLGINQLNIAKDLHIQQKTVSEIENGKLLNIPNKYIYYFHKKGISLKWMYDGSGSMMNNQIPSKNERKQESSVKKLFEESANSQNARFTDKTDKGQPLLELADSSFTTTGLINSKDFSIKSLLSYIKSQENMIDFLQKIVRKELGL